MVDLALHDDLTGGSMDVKITRVEINGINGGSRISQGALTQSGGGGGCAKPII